MDTEQIKALFASPLVSSSPSYADDPANPAALPDVSLNFLAELCRVLNAQTAFEFGSGRSTLTFLEAGLRVVSVEDSAYWMEKTVERIPVAVRTSHTPLTVSLELLWRWGVPYRSWRLTDKLQALLRDTDIVLIDSPYYAPFREVTLYDVLQQVRRGIVVLDDTRIPTLARFCARLAAANPHVLHVSVPVGHGLSLFACTADTPVRLPFDLTESLKGWRRFLRAQAS